MKASTHLFAMLTLAALELWKDPQLSLQAGVQIFDRLRDNNLDPFRIGKGEPEKKMRVQLSEVAEFAISDIGGKLARMLHNADDGIEVEISIPTLGGKVLIKRKIGRATLLQGEKVGLAIVGPPNSGKSTMVANLEHAGQTLMAQIGMVDEFWPLIVPCTAVDFDVRTPDIRRIVNGGFTGLSSEDKKPWTEEAATGVVRDFLNADKGIYFISTPGGDPDGITDTLTLPLDAAFLLIAAQNDTQWHQYYDIWLKVLNNNGVSPVGLVSSRKPDEASRTGQPIGNSVLTHIEWKHRLGFGKQTWLKQIRGRLVGARRKIEPNDLFYRDMVTLLLLDILPGVVFDRYQSAQNFARSILGI